MRRYLIALATLLLAVVALAASPTQYRFQGVDRIVVFADVHGAYPQLISILRETGVIDAAEHWQGGKTHLVSLGDLLDRGPESRKALDLLMRLEGEATAAGGAVHVLLGNHEVMNMAGDLRYVSAPDYATFAGPEDDALRETTWQAVTAKDPAAVRADFDAAFPSGYFAHAKAFASDGTYGRWLFDKPYLIVINDTAFVHAGLPPFVASLGLEATNENLHSQLQNYLNAWQATSKELNLAKPIGFQERPEALAAMGAQPQSDAIAKLQDGELFTPTGPTWYRGQALCYPDTETQNLDAALAKLGAKRVIEGHTPQPAGRVLSRFDGRVLLLDTGMLASVYQGVASALVYENGQWSVAYADQPGRRTQPELPVRAVGSRPKGLDDDALERFLQEAEIVEVEKLDVGITKPQRVTLRKDGIEVRAVLKQLSISFETEGRPPKTFDSDRWEYELAAYKLDRMIGLNMVPVTVERVVNKRRGVLQFWIENAITLKKMLEDKMQPDGWCATYPQYNLMNIFDLLIHNTDRTQQNALFTKDWTLLLIDHTRAFETALKPPTLLYQNPVEIPPSLAQRLAALDRTKLDAVLGPYLHPKQIEAILKRRDGLLNGSGLPAVQPKAATR